MKVRCDVMKKLRKGLQSVRCFECLNHIEYDKRSIFYSYCTKYATNTVVWNVKENRLEYLSLSKNGNYRYTTTECSKLLV